MEESNSSERDSTQSEECEIEDESGLNLDPFDESLIDSDSEINPNPELKFENSDN